MVPPTRNEPQDPAWLALDFLTCAGPAITCGQATCSGYQLERWPLISDVLRVQIGDHVLERALFAIVVETMAIVRIAEAQKRADI